MLIPTCGNQLTSHTALILHKNTHSLS